MRNRERPDASAGICVVTYRTARCEAIVIALFLKCLLGAAAVLIIALLSKSKSFFIAGLVPLFPTFALIAHYIIGSQRSAADLRTTALFGLWSLLPYAVYLLTVYWLCLRMALLNTLLLATAAWVIAAGVLLFGWSRLYAAAA